MSGPSLKGEIRLGPWNNLIGVAELNIILILTYLDGLVFLYIFEALLKLSSYWMFNEL
jgi:hypothetical protein